MDLIAANVSVIGVIAIIIALLALGVFIASRIRRVPPNEALIIVGRGAGQKAQSDMTGQRVVIGGRTFVWPILQQGFALSLEQRQIGIQVEGVDKNRIKIAIKASINFKVSGTEEGCGALPSASSTSRRRSPTSSASRSKARFVRSSAT